MDPISLQSQPNRKVTGQIPASEGLYAFTKQLLHDLRSPLGVIMLSSSWISDKSKQEKIAPIREANAMIIEQALYLRDLIDNADRIFDLQAHKTELKLAHVNLVEYTRQIVQDLNATKRREVILAGSLKKRLIDIDPIRFREALQLLLAFFMTYSQGTTPIRVQISDSEQHGIRITATDPDMEIPPDQLDSLFIPFNRIQFSSISAYQGYGLGIYLAKTLIDDCLKGKLNVDSKPGEGTSFEISLYYGRIG